jgi:hypothetical protein
MDEDVPLETRVSVPIRLALAGIPSWWVDKMTVHHVYLQRVRRAGKCAARMGAFAIAGGVPVRWGGTSGRNGVATSGRKGGGGGGVGDRRIVSGRVSVSVRVCMLSRWKGV